MLQISIIFEDDNILVINKPYGVSSHSSGKGNEVETIASWFLARNPEIFGVGETMESNGRLIEKWGIVHRLDKDTSGAMLLVKNSEAFEYFKNLFQSRKVSKNYFAFVYGWPKEAKGLVETEISRARGDIMRWTASRKSLRENSRNAVTQYEVIKFISENGREYSGKGSTEEGDFALLSVIPKTGRTHQIRVHMKYLNHPIICDPIYSRNTPALGFTRLALHARSLEFQNMDGKMLKIEAPFPEDFEKATKANF